MDNTEGLGAAMEASAQQDKTRKLEAKVESLEQEIQELKEIIRNLCGA